MTDTWTTSDAIIPPGVANGQPVRFGDDSRLIVVFHKGTILNEAKSTQAGAPIYDQVDMMKVIQPGEPLNIYDQPVRPQDKMRFREKWEAYEKGTPQNVSGSPLSMLFPLQPEIVQSLAAIHIITVEQLANLSDTATQNMMFGFNLREKAQQFLAIREKGAAYHQMQHKIEEQERQLKELTEKIQLLQGMAQERRKPGRPRKNPEPPAAPVAA